MVMSDWNGYSYATTTYDQYGGIAVDRDIRKEDRIKTVKTVVRFVVSGLVEIFVGAVTNSVMGRVDGSKAAKFGAKAGGFLVGMYIGDQVSDYICSGIDSTMAQLDELKEAIEEEANNG